MPKYDPRAFRRTGRSTRMVNQAIALAKAGRSVYIVVDNEEEVHRFSFAIPPGLGIKVENARRFREFDWMTMRPMRAHPNCVVLVDHHAIEDRFGALLQELHRYDE